MNRFLIPALTMLCASVVAAPPAAAGDRSGKSACPTGMTRKFDYDKWTVSSAALPACCEEGNKAFFTQEECCYDGCEMPESMVAGSRETRKMADGHCADCMHPEMGNKPFHTMANCPTCGMPTANAAHGMMGAHEAARARHRSMMTKGHYLGDGHDHAAMLNQHAADGHDHSLMARHGHYKIDWNKPAPNAASAGNRQFFTRAECCADAMTTSEAHDPSKGAAMGCHLCAATMSMKK